MYWKVPSLRTARCIEEYNYYGLMIQPGSLVFFITTIYERTSNVVNNILFTLDGKTFEFYDLNLREVLDCCEDISGTVSIPSIAGIQNGLGITAGFSYDPRTRSIFTDEGELRNTLATIDQF